MQSIVIVVHVIGTHRLSQVGSLRRAQNERRAQSNGGGTDSGGRNASLEKPELHRVGKLLVGAVEGDSRANASNLADHTLVASRVLKLNLEE